MTDREIIVVVGPGGEAMLPGLRQRGDLRVVTTDRLNVSAARNAGVGVARGQVVAFCDDDAIPEPEWLANLTAPLVSAAVGAAGGAVLDGRCRPPDQAFVNGVIRLSGKQVSVRAEPGDFNRSRGPWYNAVCGCNCAFRRDALASVGGFDEFIEFAYDETDVCLRLIAAGYAVVHTPRAVVLHGYQPGGHRRSSLVRNWYAEIKNQLYFGLQNRRGVGSACRTVLRVAGRCMLLTPRFALACVTGKLKPKQACRFSLDVVRGAAVGLRAGLGKRRGLIDADSAGRRR